MRKRVQKIIKNVSAPDVKEHIDRVKEKGYQRLTVLIIPHGFDKSFNFQISLFSILFLIFLLFSLIALSISGIVKSSKTRAQIAELSNVYGKYFDEYISLTSSLENMKEDYSQINENMNEMFTLIDGTEDELLKVPSESDVYNNSYNDLKDEEVKDPNLIAGSIYLSEIYDFRNLKNLLDSHLPLLDASYNFLNFRSQIFRHMPFAQPMFSYHLTSGYGMRRSPTSGYLEYHDGVDLANQMGTPIYATAPGRVVLVKYSQYGYGNHIIIAHKFGIYSLYGHCSRIFVHPGQTVQMGSLIGSVGATGNVTGPHLHYEIWAGEKIRSNPIEFIETGLY